MIEEDLFDNPGRYRLARQDGALRIEVVVGQGATLRQLSAPVRPAEAYAFLMARRRTELLYALAGAIEADEPAHSEPGFRDLVSICAAASESDLAALADRWNTSGNVEKRLSDLLGQRPDHDLWFGCWRKAG
ncbi:MAG: hypothetical protein AAGE80_06590 [Pseudomonadota bacterium]